MNELKEALRIFRTIKGQDSALKLLNHFGIKTKIESYFIGNEVNKIEDIKSHLGNNLKYSSCEWPNCLNKPTKDERENPSLYIENRTKELTELYKNHSIDINTFSKDLAALDSIDNLITLRMELNADPFGFDTKKQEPIPIPKDE